MKTAGTLLVALATISVAASPALAGKKRGKGRHKAAAAAKTERRLCDELGLGITIAERGHDADAAKAAKQQADAAADDGAIAKADSFDVSRLQGRKNNMPTGDASSIRMKAETLSMDQIAAVVKGNGDDVEYCWSRLPAQERSSTAATLHLSISARGAVEAVSIGGDVPAAFSSCLGTAASHWQFPIADTETVADYPLVLN